MFVYIFNHITIIYIYNIHIQTTNLTNIKRKTISDTIDKYIDTLKARSHQIKITTDWLQTSFRLAPDCKIGVNGTMLYQCNPTAFYQSEVSLKPVGSQSEANRLQIKFWCERAIG